MTLLRRSRLVACTAALAMLAAPLHAARAQQAAPVDQRLLSALTWRNLGPFRGGRVSAVTGVIGSPGTFYAGFPGGGVWKTTSAGQVWYPIFDSVREVSSVGAVEVAPSDPNVVYVGTGDMISGGTIDRGNGVYKSTDAGKTWRHLGLATTRHIQTMVVDPRDANVVMIGALGDALHRSEARGIYRSTDGGRSWTKTLYVDDMTGIAKIARAFDVPEVLFATTMRHYAPPDYPQDRLRSWQFSIPDPGDTTGVFAALYKSTDNGVSWQPVQGSGLPRLTGRVCLSVAMGTNAQRVYLITNRGLWRSDDGGANWRQQAANDARIRNGQGGYSCGVYTDPKNPDIVYTLNTVTYRSTDGGTSFTGLKGAPGGDDPQQAWIDPTNGDRILLGYDQGLTVSLDGGKTFSPWYNQSTEQLYHVAADKSYPYWLYATQQDAGAIRTRSRGNYGAVTMFDWNSVNGWEWGTLAPDPRNPNTVFATGGGVVKISYPSEQWIDMSPAVDPASGVRTTSSQPILYAPWNPAKLFVGLNFVTSSSDGGVHWTRLSPDLGIPSGLDAATAAKTPGGRGAIESLALSTVAPGVIWAGTNNGLIHVSRDEGKTWRDVSIPNLHTPRRALVSAIDASHHEAGTAYVAIEYLRVGDFTPHIYRTRDYGRTWTEIVNGLPTDEAGGSFTRVVRADSKRKGLLFAGTESGVHVSFDDGDHWQPLMQNLPTTPVRDITIKGNDLIVATHGRGMWVLDDISMLRQLTPQMASEPAHLFAPGEATRVRRNVNADTPLPPEVPHALNPPDGVIIDYWLGATPTGEVTIDVLDAGGRTVRHLSSKETKPVPEAERPSNADLWVAPPFRLPASEGANRTNWDLRRDAPPAFRHSFEINANPGLTPPSPVGALVLPGRYTLKLTVNGHSSTQTVTVRNDPRSPATMSALRAQDSLLVRLSEGMRITWLEDSTWTAWRKAVVAVKSAAKYPPPMVALADSMDNSMYPISMDSTIADLRTLNATFAEFLAAQDNGDMAPTPSMRAAFASACRKLARNQAEWNTRAWPRLPRFNDMLARVGEPRLERPRDLRLTLHC